jgi:hypothetical protein
MTSFSSKDQFDFIARLIHTYLRLPLSDDAIPGALLEGVIAHVRNAERLHNYDFVDVVNKSNAIGWQVKSTKSKTPVTWKRAKIPNAEALIDKSRKSEHGLQTLGDSIITFCNAHAMHSLKTHGLNEIFYARLIAFPNGNLRYLERKLCDLKNPLVFDPADYKWKWSTPKRTSKKEQLPALHGINKTTGSKEWAWHGLGENQLHFAGEGKWWNDQQSHWHDFASPTDDERLDFTALVDMLSKV